MIRANNKKTTRNAAPTGRKCGREALRLGWNSVLTIRLRLPSVDGPYCTATAAAMAPPFSGTQLIAEAVVCA